MARVFPWLRLLRLAAAPITQRFAANLQSLGWSRRLVGLEARGERRLQHSRAVPVGPSVTVHRGPRGTSIGVVSAPEPERQILAFLGYGACLSGFELQRFRLLAHLWRARIIIPEVPGCSRQPSRLGPRAAAALAVGRFGPVAHEITRAALRFAEGVRRTDVLGYSMGASLAAAALAAVPVQQLEADRITLVEPVALTRWTPWGLMRATKVEDALAAKYVGQSMAWRGAVPPPEDSPTSERHRDPLSMLLMGHALQFGRLLPDLSRGLAHRPSAALVVVRGCTSQLFRSAALRRALAWSRTAGVPLMPITMEGSHPLWQSLDIVESMAARVGSAWEQHDPPTS